MMRRVTRGLLAATAIAWLLLPARARSGPATPPASAPPSCKAYNGGKCCDPAVTAHLPKEAIYSSCGESEATFLGEQAGKDSCKYFFKVEGAREDETVVQLYVPPTKEPMTEPNDPFFQWKRVGRAYYTAKGASPKSQPMLLTTTGLWLGGKGYMVTVNAPTKVCSRPEAIKLATRIK